MARYRTCSVEGCTTSAARRGLCGKHFRRAIADGTELPARIKIQARAPSEFCTAEGCSDPTESKGLCSKHYQRARRGYLTDDELAARKLAQAQPDICSMDGCYDKTRARSYCYNHWYRSFHGLPMDQKVRIKRSTEALFERDEQGRKLCVSCFEWFSEDDFTVQRNRPDGKEGSCIRCVSLRNRRAKLKKQYGLTMESFDALLKDQGGCCLICTQQLPPTRIHVDHDHACCPGKDTCGNCIRGLLCSPCNTGLGAFRDSTTVLENAIGYLERSRTQASNAQSA